MILLPFLNLIFKVEYYVSAFYRAAYMLRFGAMYKQSKLKGIETREAGVGRVF